MENIKPFIIKIILLTFTIVLFRYIVFWKYIAIPLLALTITVEFRNGLIPGLKGIGDMAYSISYILDCLGNILLQVPFNLLFTKNGGYKYGATGETISSATGKNEISGTLTTTGKLFTKFLSLVFGKNHAIESIQTSF